MWTYDLTNYTMVELETMIALATMICIVETNLLSYIQWMNNCVINSSMINKYVLPIVF